MPYDNTILEMAIVGYQSELEKISAKIAEIKTQLGQRGPGRPKAAVSNGNEPSAKRSGLSAAARARIAAAQKARWDAYRKGKEGGKTAEPKPKRKLSAAGRKAIIAATKKRWAAVRAAKAAAA